MRIAEGGHLAPVLKRWLAHDLIPAIRKTGSYGRAEGDALPPPNMEKRAFPEWSLEESSSPVQAGAAVRLTVEAYA